MSRTALVLVTRTHASHGSASVARYRSDGTPDPQFAGGIVKRDILGGGDQANAVAIQPDGSIAVAGSAGEDIARARYTGQGRLDTMFGDNGTTVTDLGSDDVANGVAETPGGGIAIAGYTLGAHVNRDCLLARYTADGKVDAASTTDVGGGDDFAENLLIDPSGFVLVGRAASATSFDPAGRIVAAGDTASGPDTEFGLLRANP